MSPRDPRHWPFIGSVVDYLADQRGEPAAGIPRNVALPWRLSSRRPYAAGDNAGPYGAWLGAAYDPLWTDFQGEGTRVSTYTFGPQTIRCQDPYGPLAPGCRFTLSNDAAFPDGLTIDRLHRRKSLVEQIDASRRSLDDKLATRTFDHFRDQAYSYLTTSTLPRRLGRRSRTEATMPRPVRHDAVRPGDARRPAAAGGWHPVRHRAVGRVRVGQ